MWINITNAIILRDSSEEWGKFFDKKFKTPQECIESIPKDCIHSIATIIAYYITFYPELDKESWEWINTANAKILYDSSEEWRKFFDKKFKTPQECIESIPKDCIHSIATIIAYYITFYPELDKESWKWINTANAKILYDSSEEWGKFFDKKFKTPQECIKSIPKECKHSISTVITYYIIFYPELEKNRKWTYEANAKILYDSSEEWRKFFDKKFKTPQECIESIPKDCKQSIATIINYYIIFHPELRKESWKWIDTANARILHNNSKKWGEFFDKKFKTPQECIESIPRDCEQSISTIIAYYITFHSELEKNRQWIDTVNAKILYESNKDWKIFFDTKYKTPEEIIESLPKKCEQSTATIVNYYITFYPELQKEGRTWINSVNVKILYDSSEEWRKFFDAEYRTLQDCIKNIPKGYKQSIATIITYYCAFKKINASWIPAVNAIIFFDKFFELLEMEERLFWNTLKKYRLYNKLPSNKTIELYKICLKTNEIDIEFIKQYGNYISFFRKNPHIVTWLTQRLEEKKDIKSIVNEYRSELNFFQPSNVNKYIEVFKRYYDEDLVKEIIKM